MSSAAFVICTGNYVPQAMTALESLRTFWADQVDYHVLLIETKEVKSGILWPLWVRPHSIEELEELCPCWRHMAYYYTAMELSCALRPSFVLWLMQHDYEQVFHLDSDVMFFSKPEPNLLDQADVLLTPHLTEPEPQDGHFPAVEDCLRVGQFNMGFFGFRRTDRTLTLLRWWAACLEEQCLQDRELKYCVDQFWAAHFVSFSDRVRVLRNPGYNVAYWNIHQRTLSKHDGQWRVNGEPLVFFHFSGYALSDPERLSQHSRREKQLTPGTPLYDLVTEYRSKQEDAMRRYPYNHLPYSFGQHRSGAGITAKQRRSFLALPRSDRRRWPDPFLAGPDLTGILVPVSSMREAYVRRTWNYLGTSGAGGTPLRIALYGAGKHTQWLHDTVSNCAPGPMVVAVLDDGDQRTAPGWSIRTQHLTKFDPSSVDLVVLSTDAMASRLKDQCHKAFGEKVRVMDLYEGCPKGPY